MTIATVISDATVLDSVERAASKKGIPTQRYQSVELALESQPDGVFAEWRLDTSAGDLLGALRRSIECEVPIIVFVPRGMPDLLHRAAAAGAFDVLLTPLDPIEVETELDDMLEGWRGLRSDKRLIYENLLQTDLIGINAIFKRCLIELQQTANSDANVLLLGETGTGKEMFARAIHLLSSRASEPYLGVNCASLPENLLESELFGHVKGAFTGADRNREGRFAAVRGGTLLLDEIGDISSSLQMKLLRVIEGREFQPVGDDATRKFHGRLIAATSVDLEEAMTNGRFRPDLMGRINQFRIDLPPLRQRREDIPLLARHFLVKHSRGRPVDVSVSTMDILQDFEFPMNVRQLENVIVGALARSFPGNLLLPKHLPAELLHGSPRKPSKPKVNIEIAADCPYEQARNNAVAAVDRAYLSEFLRACHNNQSAAAEAAGIDRKTFAARWKNAGQTPME